jgi:chorismate lyase / 3-hydroxybenzoate synthase
VPPAGTRVRGGAGDRHDGGGRADASTPGEALSDAGACEVLFGAPAASIDPGRDPPALRLALECLGGDDREPLPARGHSTTSNDLHVVREGELAAGFGLARPGVDLEAATEDLYRRLFAATEGLHLHRIWNYVPQINAHDGGLENYRHFCRARAAAFETRFGREFNAVLPASSAVGASRGPLALAFVAGTTAGRHFENPLQVPAFLYPPEHGPRPPSFSRATAAQTATATHVFISGTAAIRGHATVAPGDLEAQIDCTLANLAAIGETAGAGPALGAGESWQRRFKVYLRHPGDLATVVTRLESGLLHPGDRVAYLHAEICRAELVLEIEATLTRSVPPTAG